MAQELVQYTIPDIERMAEVIAKGKLFGMASPEQVMTLMLVAQAEGRHPALAAKDYDVIQGKPAKKAEAMLRDFIASGGKVEWHALDDTQADATFSHPSGGTVRIKWDFERAKTAGLGGKDMWKKYPRQMLRSRCVSEGVRTVCPAATSGFYESNEVVDFDDKPMKNITPEVEANITPAAVAEIMESAQKRKDEQDIEIADAVIEGMKKEETLQGLQVKFSAAQKEFKGSKEFARILEAKNKRKAELMVPSEDMPENLVGDAA